VRKALWDGDIYDNGRYGQTVKSNFREDLFSDRGERLAHAYRRRAHAVAARLKA
jgi:hypothetical protein